MRTLPRRILAFIFMLAAGCGGQVGSTDSASDEAALAAPLPGIYQLVGDPGAAGDVVYLRLTASGFAWTRCYDADCAQPIVEDGTYELASSGSKYITFYQHGSADDADTHFNSMYAYSRTSKTLKLRLTHTSRWMTLAPVAESELCAASGGTWSDGGCNCGAGWPMTYSPAAGGCWLSPSAGESACDDTRGIYSDDDMNLAGTFCDCGYGRHLEDSGCVDNNF